MNGLNRIQQRFNAAIITILALAGFGGQRQAEQHAAAQGHPLARKYLRTMNVAKATGRDLPPYLGYCHDWRYRAAGGGKLR